MPRKVNYGIDYYDDDYEDYDDYDYDVEAENYGYLLTYLLFNYYSFLLSFFYKSHSIFVLLNDQE